jgi:hypothetical protein
VLRLLVLVVLVLRCWSIGVECPVTVSVKP